MTFPRWSDHFWEVPEKTQFFLWKHNNGFGAVVPLLDGDYQSTLTGSQEGLRFFSDCGEAGQVREELCVAVLHTGSDPYRVMEEAMSAAVRWMKRGRLRAEKPAPRWMDRVGWCTWDAFYSEVNEERILEGLRAFRDAGFVPGFLIIDDGWQETAGKGYLLGFGTAEGKFQSDSLSALVRRCKEEFGVQTVGCWRTLFGGMRGVDPVSGGLEGFGRKLVREPGTESDTFGVVALEDVARFQEAYCVRLASQGIGMVKVDFQSALGLMTYEQAGRCAAARVWQESLQEAVRRNFGGEMLNCMAMATPEAFHTPQSNVIRSSEDFFPSKDEAHPAHIRQNLYNALWLSQLQWTDWDMFQSQHPWAEYHAIGRAISGGPVYVSDKPGCTDAALLERFVDAQGEVLRCPQPALPVRSQLFLDPIASGRMIRAFNRCGECGMIAVFHPLHEPSSPPLTETVSPEEVEGYSGGTCFTYSLRHGLCGIGAPTVQLHPRQADLFIFSPVQSGIAVFGLVEKWNPPAAILAVERKNETIEIRTRCGGDFGFAATSLPREVRVNGSKTAWRRRPDGLLVIATPPGSECLIALVTE